MLDVKKIKSQFPIFQSPLNASLVYLDNAATTQKPLQVIDKMVDYYTHHNANIHRGLYALAHRSDTLFESARQSVVNFFGAQQTHEAIFCKGTTEGINMVAHSFVAPRLRNDSNIVITALEHHANFVPWQQLSLKHGCQLRVAPVLEDGQLDMKQLEQMIDKNTAIVAVTYLSNTLGTICDISTIKKIADMFGVPLLIDGAQSTASIKIDLEQLDPAFYVFSGHKVFGPTGIGSVLVSKKYSNQMRPYQYGGDMIKKVSVEETTFADFPRRMEAGTPNIAGAVGLSEALRFINEIGLSEVHTHQVKLREYGIEQLSQLDDISIIGPVDNGSSIISFQMKGVHPHDVATLLAEQHVAVRAGHHCTQPLLRAMSLQATVRASFSIYNNESDIDKLVAGLQYVRKIFKS